MIYIIGLKSVFRWDRLPLHSIPSPDVNEEYWSRVLRPDALPGINHMHGIQYLIGLNIKFESETQLIQLYKFVCIFHTQNRYID